jgi:hypothetical protein
VQPGVSPERILTKKPKRHTTEVRLDAADMQMMLGHLFRAGMESILGMALPVGDRHFGEALRLF